MQFFKFHNKSVFIDFKFILIKIKPLSWLISMPSPGQFSSHTIFGTWLVCLFLRTNMECLKRQRICVKIELYSCCFLFLSPCLVGCISIDSIFKLGCHFKERHYSQLHFPKHPNPLELHEQIILPLVNLLQV